MGCNCNKNRIISPENAMDLNTKNWGPVYWAVLHTLAEITGRRGTASADSEEGYLWDYLLRELGGVLPCAECQRHYSQYYESHRPFFIFGSSGEDRRTLLRKWLYDLHATTPRLSDCPVPTLEEMSEKYSLAEININEDIKKMYEFFNAGVAQGILNGMHMYAFKSKIELMRITMIF
jgi:hypothetical protein